MTVAVPQPLIEQAVSMLSRVLASIFGRSLTRFFFSRSVLGTDPELILATSKNMYTILKAAREAGSIVITTGASIKALLLKTVELMETSSRRAKGWQVSLAIAVPLRGILELWTDGVALLDECDLLLHPLRSEMNFPIHEKKPLAMMAERTLVAERLVDGFFVGLEDTVDDRRLRAAIRRQLEKGKAEKALQSSPHVVLADKEFYQPHLLPVLADWLLPALRERLEHRDALLAPLAASPTFDWFLEQFIDDSAGEIATVVRTPGWTWARSELRRWPRLAAAAGASRQAAAASSASALGGDMAARHSTGQLCLPCRRR